MLGEMLTSAAQAWPDKPALIVRSDTVSFRQFDTSTDALARNLLGLGLQPGDRVAFQLTNGLEAAICHFACFKAGLIGVPCNTRLAPPEVVFALGHSQARVYIGGNDSYQRFASSSAELPGLEHILLIDRAPLPEHALSFDALIRTAMLQQAPPGRLDPDAGSLILYTSGTSARPKGVLHTHRSMHECARAWVGAVALDADERVLLMSPMMHMSGMCSLLAAVSVAATSAIVPVMDAAAALDTLERVGCTHTFGLPVSYHLLLREQQSTPRRVDTLRTALGGGDSVTAPLIEAFRSTFGVTIQEGHGMSECAPNIANPRGGGRVGSMGVPVAGVEARVDAPPGEIGELLLRSPAMFARYWCSDDETRRAFDDGFLRTGDLARVDGDGFFWFCGRRKEIIVHGGANVSPQEVEEALCCHPAVAQAGVVGLPDPVWGEAVHASVVLKPGASTTADALRAFAAEALAEWKVPSSIAIEPTLPLGATGKVQRRLLREHVLG